MDPSKAAVLAVASLLGLLVLAQSRGGRASALSLRPHPPSAEEGNTEVRCETVRVDGSKSVPLASSSSSNPQNRATPPSQHPTPSAPQQGQP